MPAEEPMGCVSQRFAWAEYSTAIRRYETVALCETAGDGQAGHPCGGNQAASKKFATRNPVHACSLGTPALPMIISRIRRANPVTMTIPTWTIKNSTRDIESRK